MIKISNKMWKLCEKVEIIDECDKEREIFLSNLSLRLLFYNKMIISQHFNFKKSQFACFN